MVFYALCLPKRKIHCDNLLVFGVGNICFIGTNGINTFTICTKFLTNGTIGN